MHERKLGLFAVFAVAALAPLLVPNNLIATEAPDQVVQYLPVAAPVIALGLWHWLPGRVWPWLLLAGTLFSIPVLLAALHVPVTGGDAVLVLQASAPAVGLIGVLGAATWLHHQGRPATGAAIMGTALLCKIVGSAVLLTAGAEAVTFSRMVTIVLYVVGAIGAIGSVVLCLTTSMPAIGRPAWRATAAGVVGAVSVVLPQLWQPDGLADGPYLLRLGLVFLGIGIVVGGLGGPRVLLGAAASGLLMGSFASLIEPAVEVLREYPVAAIIAVLVSAAIADVVAASVVRQYVAVGGLGVVAVGLLLLFVLFDSDDPLTTSDPFDQVFTPILVVIGIIAAGCAFAGTGSVLADGSAPPAVLAGALTPFSLGAVAIVTYLTRTKPDDRAPIVGLLPPVIIAVLLAVTLLVVLTRLRSRQA